MVDAIVLEHAEALADRGIHHGLVGAIGEPRGVTVSEHGDDAGQAFRSRAVDGGDAAARDGGDEQAHLIDQSGGQQGAVDSAASFEHQRAHAQAGVDLLECERKVDARSARDQVGHAAVPQLGELIVGDELGENCDQMIALEVARVPHEPSTRVQGEREGVVLSRLDEVVAGRTLVLSRDLLVRSHAGRKMLHRHSPAQPPVGRVRRVHQFVLPTFLLGERPTIGNDAAIVGVSMIPGQTAFTRMFAFSRRIHGSGSISW